MKTLFLIFLLIFSQNAFSQTGNELFPTSSYEQFVQAKKDLRSGDLLKADEKFLDAHTGYIRWASENGVDISLNPLFEENLDHWVSIKMIINPAAAVLMLEELEFIDSRYSKDLLDYRIISSVDPNFEDALLKQYEERSEAWRDRVFSSRMLYTVLKNIDDSDVLRSIFLFLDVSKDDDVKVLEKALKIIIALEEKEEGEVAALMDEVVESLVIRFTKDSVNSLREVVLETLIYTRIFEAAGAEVLMSRLRDEVSNVYMRH